MSLYERRLEADREEIRRRVVALGRTVEAAVAGATAAALVADTAACARLILADLPINRESRAIDGLCHAFVARHLPSAGHLRFVSSVMRMNVAIERIGDYAVTICREMVQLGAPVAQPLVDDLGWLDRAAREVLSEALDAFETDDVELARNARPRAKGLLTEFDRVFRVLATGVPGLPGQQRYALHGIFTKLQRVTDQAKNIGEETVFAATGETKAPKRYRILFVDARCSTLAPLAQALARKAFPNSGHYEIGGWAPADALSPSLKTLEASLGLDLSRVLPVELRTGLAGHHVVVGLVENAARHLPTLPFHTPFLEWTLPSLADASDPESGLRDIARALATEIRELMTTLRGELAD